MRAHDYKQNGYNVLMGGGNDGGSMDLEPRMAKIESKVESIDKRLDNIDKDIRELRDEVKSNFKWLLAIFIPLFVSGTAATIFTIIFHK